MRMGPGGRSREAALVAVAARVHLGLGVAGLQHQVDGRQRRRQADDGEGVEGGLKGVAKGGHQFERAGGHADADHG